MVKDEDSPEAHAAALKLRFAYDDPSRSSTGAAGAGAAREDGAGMEVDAASPVDLLAAAAEHRLLQASARPPSIGERYGMSREAYLNKIVPLPTEASLAASSSSSARADPRTRGLEMRPAYQESRRIDPTPRSTVRVSDGEVFLLPRHGLLQVEAAGGRLLAARRRRHGAGGRRAQPLALGHGRGGRHG